MIIPPGTGERVSEQWGWCGAGPWCGRPARWVGRGARWGSALSVRECLGLLLVLLPLDRGGLGHCRLGGRGCLALEAVTRVGDGEPRLRVGPGDRPGTLLDDVGELVGECGAARRRRRVVAVSLEDDVAAH